MGHRQAYHEGKPELQGTWQRRRLKIGLRPGHGLNFAVGKVDANTLFAPNALGSLPTSDWHGHSVRWVQSSYQSPSGLSGVYKGWPACTEWENEFAEDTDDGNGGVEDDR